MWRREVRPFTVPDIEADNRLPYAQRMARTMAFPWPLRPGAVRIRSRPPLRAGWPEMVSVVADTRAIVWHLTDPSRLGRGIRDMRF